MSEDFYPPFNKLPKYDDSQLSSNDDIIDFDHPYIHECLLGALPLVKKTIPNETNEKKRPPIKTEKSESIKRYRRKRKLRCWSPRTIYDCRSEFAIRRPRIHGRFISTKSNK